MKFKVGDKVFVKTYINDYQRTYGKIISINKNAVYPYLIEYLIEYKEHKENYFYEDEIFSIINIPEYFKEL